MTRRIVTKIVTVLAVAFMAVGSTAAAEAAPTVPDRSAPPIEEWRLDLTDGDQEKVTFELQPTGTPTSLVTIDGVVAGRTVVLRRVTFADGSVVTFGNALIPQERW